MKTSHNSKDLEKEIIENAKQLFIEKGFAETSMSDIAARTGINRPVLHYYFRTKDKMFQAVFGSIVLSFVPQVQDIILQKDLPFRERAGKIIDAYYQTFIDNPCLPMFMIREIYRDPGHLLAVIQSMSCNWNNTCTKSVKASARKWPPDFSKPSPLSLYSTLSTGWLPCPSSPATCFLPPSPTPLSKQRLPFGVPTS